MLEVLLFVMASAGLIYVSRASLIRPRSHGFYRFIAWELILVLFLINWRMWFDEPTSAHQLISWLLLISSLFLVLQGVAQLRRYGKPDPRRNETPMIGIEKTSTLVTTGIYKYIRHPLYSSLLFLGMGIFFKQPSWTAGLLGLGMTIFLLLTARVEEEEDIRYFGTAYLEYRRQTRMFIPFLF